jgi:hypothetical protein
MSASKLRELPIKTQIVVLLGLIMVVVGGLVKASQWLQAKPSQNPEDDLVGFRPFRPTDSWNTIASKAPVDPNSKAIIEMIGAELPLRPDFGSSMRFRPFGIPYNIVASQVKGVPVEFDYESDPGDYPIPENVRIEGGAESKGDRHILMVDRENAKLYELFKAYPKPDGTWRAISGAIFDLRYNTRRPQGWTSADAAGLPIFPGLVRYDEVARGEIPHALRFTVAKTRAAYVPPATHKASSLNHPYLPPMGMRVRLKESVPIDDLPPQARVIARALKTHGMLLADNGGTWFLSGTPDRRWDDKDLSALKRLKGHDFEVVKQGWTGDIWEERRGFVLKEFFMNADRVAKQIIREYAGLPLEGPSRQAWIEKLIQLNANTEFKLVLQEMREEINKGRDVGNAMDKYPNWFDKDIISAFHEAELKGDLSPAIKLGVDRYGNR